MIARVHNSDAAVRQNTNITRNKKLALPSPSRSKRTHKRPVLPYNLHSIIQIVDHDEVAVSREAKPRWSPELSFTFSFLSEPSNIPPIPVKHLDPVPI
jgi:hypothetical protein